MRLDSQRSRSTYSSRHRPPPDYFARRVQIKVLALVFLFMGVLVMMDHARDPANWRWMWQLEGQGTPMADGPAVQTRMPLQPAADPPGVPGAQVTGDQAPSEAERPGGQHFPEDLQQLLLQGWTRVLNQLSPSQRRLLPAALWDVRHDRSWSPAQTAAWQALIPRLDQLWTAHLDQVAESVAASSPPLSDQQRDRCARLIARAAAWWNELKPALAAAANPDGMTVAQRQQLAGFQAVLDRQALQQVEDNAPMRRPEEHAAWFRLWEKLAAQDARNLAAAPGPVSFVQLFSQPHEYRGRLVKVRGTVRSAYYAVAPDNAYQVQGYYALALQASPRDETPIRVFCRELPEGFPAVGGPDRPGEAVRLNETAEFVGYFFKRAVYASADGPQLAPVVLARLTAWQPASPAATSQPLPGLWSWLAGIAGALILAVAVAVWAYRHSSGTPISRVGRRPGSGVGDLSDDDLRMAPSQALEQLAEQTEWPHESSEDTGAAGAGDRPAQHWPAHGNRQGE